MIGTILTRFRVAGPGDLPPAAQEWFYHNFKPYQQKNGKGKKLPGKENRREHPLPRVTMPSVSARSLASRERSEVRVFCNNCGKLVEHVPETQNMPRLPRRCRCD